MRPIPTQFWSRADTEGPRRASSPRTNQDHCECADVLKCGVMALFVSLGGPVEVRQGANTVKTELMSYEQNVGRIDDIKTASGPG